MGKKRVAENIEEGTVEPKAASGKKRKKVSRLDSSRIYISASYNNTSIAVTDSSGNLLVWSSAGSLGFRGPKKATPYAASRAVDNIFEKLKGADLGRVSIYVKGMGTGRDSAVRSVAGKGINVVSLHDITPVPHNGCRPRKARRV